MDKDELQAVLDAQAERLRKEFAREKPWWGDRFKAMRADPQTAALAAIFGFVAAKWGGALLGVVTKFV